MLPSPLPLVLGAPLLPVVVGPFELRLWDGFEMPAVVPYHGVSAYKPGQAVSFGVQCFVDGVLTDPASPPTLTVYFPDETTATGTVVRDAAGMYHADVVIPVTMRDGNGAYRWQLTGASADANALGERRFTVAALDF